MTSAKSISVFVTTRRPSLPPPSFTRMYSADAYGGLGMSTLGGPMASDNYKRAVHRPPPSKFTVEMLAPTKQGGSYAFGMRISPALRGDRSSTGSGGSNRSFSEPYEIWRRWEDCLWFQETIEVEYGRLARMKKQRLAKGKGVKKGGFYMQDQASSWESLPPGPDPNSVAQDVHNLVPRLTKKGTLFRVSQTTIDHRQAELSAFVQALFRDDVPALLEELRSDRMVTDFFGYWRRDYDLEQKRQGRLKKYRNSMADSILSFYSGPGPDDDSRSFTTTSSPTFESFPRSSISSVSSSESASPKKSRSRSRPLSGSSDSSSGSSPSSGGSITVLSSSPSIVEEVPIVFGHNPRVQSLQSLPEDVDAVPLSPGAESFVMRRVKKRSSRETLYRRSARIFSTPLSQYLPQENSVDESQEPPETPRNPRANRESWQTIGSVDTYLEGLGVTMPSSPTQIYHRSRLSIGSIATIMTTSSTDAVIPREVIVHSTSGSNASPKIGNRRSRPVSIMTASDIDGSWSDGDEEILDSGLFDAFPMPAHLFPHRVDVDSLTLSDNSAATNSRDQYPIHPETPSARRASCVTINGLDDIEERPETPSTVADEVVESPSTPRMSIPPIQLHVTPAPPSPARSDFSTATASTNISVSSNFSTSTTATSVTAVSDTSILSHTSSGTWTIKAAHNHSIILLRVPKTTTFDDLRDRIHAKFVHQEGISLSETFTLAFVIPDVVKNRKTGKTRERSNSVGAVGGVQMALVTSQEQWDRVTESSGDLGKITLRVLDGM
ncbi:hypothetical protein Moror_3887 [Moniliophthora roreri MCA 2997]|uniref:PX domain-containing protein n=1 Tax=Moniliophthora roreri (strain MCA 2997) TaxID=1381753 RepID=V2XNN5_MONRO|nr:hypothetical protein Moror_3887 [Moniliophthora roreri MCA 2997]